MEREVKRYKVKEPCVLMYGCKEHFRCVIAIGNRQVWYLVEKTNEYAKLERNDVTIYIDIDRFNKTFMED